jgi:hypothetical protein
VNVPGLIGFIFVLIFLGILLFFGVIRSKVQEMHFRDIPAFARIQRAIGLSVEDGSRLHFSLGRGPMNAIESAVTFVGLRMLERVTRIISISDRLPVVTSGDGAVNVLSQDTLQSTYRDLGEEAQYDPAAGRLTGPTPFSFVGGIVPIVSDEQVSASVLIGHFGSEVAYITDAAERSNGATLAGTDDLGGQAVLYAAADEPLIGEEVYAGGYYLGAGSMHAASLKTQDIFRWVIIVIILLGALLKLAGMENILLSLLMRGA